MMRKRTIIVALLGALISGCSAAPETQPSNNRAAQTTADKTSSGPAANEAPPTTETSAKSDTNSHSNAVATQPDNLEIPLDARRRQRLERMRSEGKAAGAADIESSLRESARPAPENSTFAFALGARLVERRIFRSHPLIGMVEKTTEGDKKTIRLLTRDGRTIEIPAANLEAPLSTVSSEAILKAAGLSGPPAAVRSEKKPPAD